MKLASETIRKARRFAEGGLFFLPYYLYVWLCLDPRLIRHGIGILSCYQAFSFHLGWPFLVEHLGRVGGPVQYATRLLTELYAFGWLGALILTAAAWLMARSVDTIRRRAGVEGSKAVGLRYIPAAILLLMHGGYSHPLTAVLSLLAALGAYAIFLRFASKTSVVRFGWFAVAFSVTFWIAGSGSLLFAILVALDEAIVNGSKRVAAAVLALAAVLPAALAVLLGFSFQATYSGFMFDDPGITPGRWSHTLALFLVFPTALMGTALWGASGKQKQPPVESKQRKRSAATEQKNARRWSMRIPADAMAAVGAVALTAVLAWFSLDMRTRSVLEADYYAHQGLWTQTLAALDRAPAGVYNLRNHRNAMLSLYHTGRLCDEMFRFNQIPSRQLHFPPPELRDLGSYSQESQWFLELGEVNHAERCAYEALVGVGDQPATLRQLAAISEVKGRPQTARMFWTVLEKHPFDRRAARAALARLDAAPSTEDDPQVQRLRANMLVKDRVAPNAGVEDFLKGLLERNPRNRLACELLMAHYLLEKRPDLVTASASHMADFYGPRLPRHIQEALVLDAEATGRSPGDIAGIEPQTVARFWEFRQILSSSRDPQTAGDAAIRAGMNDSYFFYYAFGFSGR